MVGLRRALWSSAIAVALTASASAQADKPDFSGGWILESAQTAAPDVARTLGVRQSLVRTNVRGEPMTPFFKDITITRGFPNAIHTEAFMIGALGGMVGGLSKDGRPTGEPQREFGVTWDRESLVFVSAGFTGGTPRSGTWTERREVWSLARDGRLHVLITTSGSGVESRTTTLVVYRRQ